MEKAIEIKRRAQRAILNGDLEGALVEYEKLAATEDSDPYNYVLLADLTFKKGDQRKAIERYLQAANSYEKAGLYKNAIAVCKKMIRLKVSNPLVLKRLAGLHALDGLATESALYAMQYAEVMSHEAKYKEAAESLRQAFDTCPENIRALEKLAEVLIMDGDEKAAGLALAEAAVHYERAGSKSDADRCRRKAEQLHPGASGKVAADPHVASAAAAAPAPPPPSPPAQAPAAAAPMLSDYQGHDEPVTPKPEAGNGGVGMGRTIDLDGDAAEAAPAAPLGHNFLEPGGGALEKPAPPLERADERPGLRFGPAHEAEPEPEPAPPTRAAPVPRAAAPAPAPAPARARAAADGPGTVQEVEAMLRQAETEFRSGDREGAGQTLMRAAQGYEHLGKLESAAVIYRSLSKSATAPPEVTARWLENCERRGQTQEAAQVACEVGDRLISEGDPAMARAWFERAIGLDPANEHARRRLARLDSQGVSPAQSGEIPAPAAGHAPPPPVSRAQAQTAPDGKLNVGMGNVDVIAPDLSAMLNEFQRGVEALISDDAQSNYDLGMAYREMGLLEQAIDCFRVAARDPGFGARCAEMIGRSLLDQGMFDDAVKEFSTALMLPGLDEQTAISLHFQLGLAHEAAGRPHEALAEFEAVYTEQQNYPDVASKIRALRRILENV